MAADGSDGNGLQQENFRLNFSSCFHLLQTKSGSEIGTESNVTRGGYGVLEETNDTDESATISMFCFVLIFFYSQLLLFFFTQGHESIW